MYNPVYMDEMKKISLSQLVQEYYSVTSHLERASNLSVAAEVNKQKGKLRHMSVRANAHLQEYVIDAIIMSTKIKNQMPARDRLFIRLKKRKKNSTNRED